MNNRPTPQTPLMGLDILIVEDRYLIASDLERQVHAMGGSVVGPAANLAEATALLDSAANVDLALLDVNLDGEQVYPLAQALSDKGKPFIFLTGYDETVLPKEWRDRPRLDKPVDSRALHERLARLRGQVSRVG